MLGSRPRKSQTTAVPEHALLTALRWLSYNPQLSGLRIDKGAKIRGAGVTPRRKERVHADEDVSIRNTHHGAPGCFRAVNRCRRRPIDRSVDRSVPTHVG